MILTLDVGNSNIKTGIWGDEDWIYLDRTDTHPVRDARHYYSYFKALFDEAGVKPAAIDDTMIGSVVPDATAPLTEALRKLLNSTPRVLNANMAIGLTINTDEPSAVGADLIAGAVAAHQQVEGPCIFVDFGTATTVMAVSASAELLGGAICAGLKASVNALVGDTAQLPDIELEIPSSPIGKNTVECMQTGLVGGHLAMAEGLIERMRDEIGVAQVVATGGLVPILAPHTGIFDYVEPTLVLDGLRLILERQADGKREM